MYLNFWGYVLGLWNFRENQSQPVRIHCGFTSLASHSHLADSCLRSTDVMYMYLNTQISLGVLPSVSHIGTVCAARRVWFLHYFDLKTGTDFAKFGLE